MSNEQNRINVHDAFSFRCGERVQLRIRSVEDCQYAVMAAPITPLPQPSRAKTKAGDTVEACCIVAAEVVNGLWQWLILAPDAKEVIGNIIFDNDLERGVWHGMVITKPTDTTLYELARDSGPKEEKTDG